MDQKLHDIPEIKLSYFSNALSAPSIRTSHDVYELLLQYFDDDQLDLREEFVVLYLNRAHRVIGVHRHSHGSAVSTVTDLRIMFAVALKSNAISMIIAHNHPSGNLKPSPQDISLTEKVKSIAKFHDIAFLDHMIVTRSGYYSFADEGDLAL